MMYPLLLSSVFMVAIVLERLLTLRERNVMKPEVISAVEHLTSMRDVDLARNICINHSGPYPNVMATCLENAHLDRDSAIQLVEDAGRQETQRLNRGLRVLETIAAVAPLMGLLGTVLGMIKVFGVIQVSGVGQAAVLSGGISQALLTTACGLFIGIPALIFYNYFASKSENLALSIERRSGDLLNKLQRIRSHPDELGQTHVTANTAACAQPIGQAT